MMQFNRIAAFMVPGRTVILQPDLPAQSYLYEAGGSLVPNPQADPELERLAIAYSWFTPLMIQHDWYRDAPLP